MSFIYNNLKCLLNDIPMTQVCKSTEAHKLWRSCLMWPQSPISSETLISDIIGRSIACVCLCCLIEYKVSFFQPKYILYLRLKTQKRALVSVCTLLATVEDWSRVADQVHWETMVVAVSPIETFPPC